MCSSAYVIPGLNVVHVVKLYTLYILFQSFTCGQGEGDVYPGVVILQARIISSQSVGWFVKMVREWFHWEICTVQVVYCQNRLDWPYTHCIIAQCVQALINQSALVWLTRNSCAVQLTQRNWHKASWVHILWMSFKIKHHLAGSKWPATQRLYWIVIDKTISLS